MTDLLWLIVISRFNWQRVAVQFYFSIRKLCLLVLFVHPITECYTVPGAPPRNVTGIAQSPTTILVSWEPPPTDRSNGNIAYYKVHVVESGRSDSEARVIKLNDTQYLLDELKKWTEYRIWVLAGTSVGDGPPSYPMTVRTHEDGMYNWPDSIQFLTKTTWNGNP